MKLYLVQHGEAVAKEINPDRPLSERGVRDMEKIARLLRQGEISAGRVLHSGKLRAEQTAKLLAAAIMPEGEPESVEGINPNDDIAAFAKRLNNLDMDTLIAGHLPFMARLVSWLITGNREQETLAYQPGSVVCLQRTGEDKWILEWMIRPELLRD